MTPERPPDPFRPGKIERGRPFAKLGRPGFAASVVLALVAVVIVVVVVAALR